MKVGALFGVDIYATTTMRIRRHADYKNKQQDSETRRQTILRILVTDLLCLSLGVSVHGLLTRVCSHHCAVML